MQALVLAGDASTDYEIPRIAAEAGFRCILYADPVRAMDNALSIQPDIFIIDEARFPRHCELVEGLVAALPGWRRFQILKVVPGEPAERLFKRLASVSANLPGTGKATLRFRRRSADSPILLFLHPRRLTPLSFSVCSLSSSGLSAHPDNPVLSSELSRPDLLQDCSLRIGERIIDFSAIIDLSVTGARDATERDGSVVDPCISIIYDHMNTCDRAFIIDYIDNYILNTSFNGLIKT